MYKIHLSASFLFFQNKPVAYVVTYMSSEFLERLTKVV